MTVPDAVGAARRLLALPEDGEAPGLGEVRALIAALSARLAQDGEAGAVAAAQAAQDAELERIEQRTAAVDRVLGAVASLRTITAPAALLSAAPEALSAGSRFDRAVLSLVRDGVMEADAVHVRDDPHGADTLLAALREHPVRLEHPLVETEALRRRRATHHHGRRRATRGWTARPPRSWAGRRTSSRRSRCARRWSRCCTRTSAVTMCRTRATPSILWTFATGLAQAFESASLRRTLRHERRQMRRLLGWIDARSSELADATVELVPRERVDMLPQPEELDGSSERAPSATATAARSSTRCSPGARSRSCACSPTA